MNEEACRDQGFTQPEIGIGLVIIVSFVAVFILVGGTFVLDLFFPGFVKGIVMVRQY